jgi:PPK2 family polyphosphate:nucleotide phosphotransferase
VRPGQPAALAERPTSGRDLFPDKAQADGSLEADALAIDDLQDRLHAQKGASLLLVLQGIDTSGKDGATKAVFRHTTPLGVRVHAFGVPTPDELARDFLWRVHAKAPPKGEIAVFNRSHYEDVLVVKVRELAPAADVEKRYAHINAFEALLADAGCTIVKCMLHVSREEQGKRLRERLEVPRKRWKFNPRDLDDRQRWDAYQQAYDVMLTRCSTSAAPWHVVPADSRTRRDAIIARLVRGALEDIAPDYPDPGWRPEQFNVG